MSLCGLKKKSYKIPRPVSAVGTVSTIREDTSVQHQSANFIEKFESDDPCPCAARDVTDRHHSTYSESRDEPRQALRCRSSADFTWPWAREDQLSVILETLSEAGSRRESEPTWERHRGTESGDLDVAVRSSTTPSAHPYPLQNERTQRYIPSFKRTRFIDQDIPEHEYYVPEDKMSDNSRPSPEIPRPIAPPPQDLESISRVDASLVFQHFTTDDAWELGSALRNRLLPIPTPVVINISLANQNQTLFHTCTHSGVMPDNDIWVARKRKTVLRWGCSTWYMHCKFNGDEAAFRDKFGLGNEAGQYAIHGGGIPIRVTGVEGVVAVVVVSGLKQDQDHAVIVEVIKELYY